MTIRFTKWHGLGNDFVVLDRRADPEGPLARERLRHLADRRRGVGCDQVIVLRAASSGSDADAVMEIFNSDGSQAGACGNAARCVVAGLAADLGRTRIKVETRDRIIEGELLAHGLVRVDMGPPRFEWRDIPLARETDPNALDLGPDADGLGPGTAVSMGNPHCVFFGADPDNFPVETVGPRLEHHALFPDQANIGFARIVSPESIRLRVWERGAGLTQACGSGACAAAVAAIRRGHTGTTVDVTMDGGPLTISWTPGGPVMMTGPSTFVFDGLLAVEDAP